MLGREFKRLLNVTFTADRGRRSSACRVAGGATRKRAEAREFEPRSDARLCGRIPTSGAPPPRFSVQPVPGAPSAGTARSKIPPHSKRKLEAGWQRHPGCHARHLVLDGAL